MSKSRRERRAKLYFDNCKSLFPFYLIIKQKWPISTQSCPSKISVPQCTHAPPSTCFQRVTSKPCSCNRATQVSPNSRSSFDVKISIFRNAKVSSCNVVLISFQAARCFPESPLLVRAAPSATDTLPTLARLESLRPRTTLHELVSKAKLFVLIIVNRFSQEISTQQRNSTDAVFAFFRPL